MPEQHQPSQPTNAAEGRSVQDIQAVAQVIQQVQQGRAASQAPQQPVVSASAAATLPTRAQAPARPARVADAASGAGQGQPEAATSLSRRELWQFVGLALLGIVLLTLAWSQLGGWLALPSAYLAAWVLELGASGWVQSVDVTTQVFTVHSSLRISTAETGWRWSEIILDLNPARYGYSLAVLWALLLAARTPGWPLRLLWGALLLVPFQAFSIVSQGLMQLCLASGLDLGSLHIVRWQLELIVYAYQFGSLVVPPLSPLLLWLWLERDFVRRSFVLVAPQAR